MDSDSLGRKLNALTISPDERRSPEGVALLRKALADRSNRTVKRAAELIADAENHAFIDDLLKAYHRLLVDPIKSDPGCVGKTPILRALVRLEFKDAELYREAIVYEQFEPIWGGQKDAAAELRGIAAAGLVNCTTSFEVLNRCAVLLTDPEVEARCGAAHAIAILGQLEGTALLRLKLLVGDGKPEVLGSCAAALLRLDREGGVEFVSRFLSSPDADVCIQVALALAESRRPDVFEPLRLAWERQQDTYAQKSLLVCIGLLRSDEAQNFLLSVVDRKNLRTAGEAIKLLKNWGATAELRQRIATAVESIGNADLAAIFVKEWGASS